MDLIERYLTTVALLLPKTQREDITAELRDVLINRLEEREADLGRSLRQDEIAAVLRDFGHPLVVAARYGRQQYLVGPEFYPLYAFAVKVQLAIIALAALVTGVVAAAAHPGEPAHGILAALGTFWNGAIISVGVLTIIAAILQRQNVRLKFLERWNPEDLPSTPKRRRETWFDHVASIIVQTLFVLWWTGVTPLWIPYVSYIPLKAGQSLSLAPAPIWHDLFWPVLGLAVTGIAVRLMKLFGRFRGATAHGADLAVQAATVAVAALALSAGRWVLVTATGLPAGALAKTAYGVNIGFQVALIMAIVMAASLGLYNAWGMARARRDRR
jgi:hypothetical protein